MPTKQRSLCTRLLLCIVDSQVGMIIIGQHNPCTSSLYTHIFNYTTAYVILCRNNEQHISLPKRNTLTRLHYIYTYILLRQIRGVHVKLIYFIAYRAKAQAPIRHPFVVQASEHL